MGKIFLPILLQVLSLNLLAAEASSPIVTFSGDDYVGTHLNFFQDPGSRLKLNEIQNQAFINSNDKIPNFGLTQATIWAQFELFNPTDELKDLVLEYDYAPIDELDLYYNQQESETWANPHHRYSPLAH